MRPETIEKMCCPFDKADLTLTKIAEDKTGNITEGFFNCSSCNRIFPIVKGIPIMSPDEYREPKLEQPLFQKWQAHLGGRSVDNFRLTATGNANAEVKQIDK